MKYVITITRPISQRRQDENKIWRPLPSDINSHDINDVDVNTEAWLVKAQTSVVTSKHTYFHISSPAFPHLPQITELGLTSRLTKSFAVHLIPLSLSNDSLAESDVVWLGKALSKKRDIRKYVLWMICGNGNNCEWFAGIVIFRFNVTVFLAWRFWIHNCIIISTIHFIVCVYVMIYSLYKNFYIKNI